ncbi:MAG: exostosin family protein [Aridibacter famidurans]|nr:exostosin family protein [Aridibacter famidurans]
MKIFVDTSPLLREKAKNLNPLFKHHWQDLSEADILAGHSNPESPLELVENPEEAQYVALLMHWSYYLWNQKARFSEAIAAASLAEKCHKKLIVWYVGDLVPKVPFDNAIVFLPGIVGNQTESKRACPIFIDDPSQRLSKPANGFRQKESRPNVGFCGYASPGMVKTIWSLVQGIQVNVRSKLGRYDYDSVPMIPTTILRARILNQLRKDPLVNTEFILRQKHTPKTTGNNVLDEERRNEFFSNVYGNDYTVCVRGYGNWSYRFYETLACGRIPIFVNTDCVLPGDSAIQWRKCCVWIEEKDVKHISEILLEFHSDLDPEEFVELQKEARRLWERHATPKGFIRDLDLYL